MAENESPSTVKDAVAKGVFERIKTLDYPQFLSVALLAAIAAGGAYGIPWAVNRIEAYGERMEAAHRDERAASEKRLAEAAQSAHEQAIKNENEWRTQIQKQWDRLERLIDVRLKAALESPLKEDPGT